MTARLCIQLMLAVLLGISAVAQIGLPPRPIDGKIGIQDERARMIQDERGRIIRPDRPLGALESPYLYYSFTNGSLTATNTILDASGNGRTSEIVSGLALTSSGRIGYGVHIRNTDVVEFDNTAASDFISQFTVRAWVFITNWNYASFFHATGSDGFDPYSQFFRLTGSPKMGLTAVNRGAATNIQLVLNVSEDHPLFSVFPTNTLELQSWTQLVLTYDGSAVALYKNGSLCTNVPWIVTNISSASLLQFGPTCCQGWSGTMDEIGIWNDRTWTAAQVLSDYNSGAGRTFP